MKARIISLVLLASVLRLCPLHAQWVQTGTALWAGPTSDLDYGGAMCYRDGVTWAGRIGLWKSLDSGLTWKAVTFNTGKIVDIQFLDKNTGLVATIDNGIYLTTNGGTSWTSILSVSNARSACFDGSSSDILVSKEANPGIVYRSRNGGLTWAQTTVAQPVRQLIPKGAGAAYVLTEFGPGNGYLYITFDYGATWNSTPGPFGYDSWSFAMDSCDEGHLAVVNEAYHAPSNLQPNSQVFVTSNGGISYATVKTIVEPYFAGSIAISDHTIFCPTLQNGVARTTDNGGSWTMIGGPTVGADTHLLSAISNNLILIADNSGNIWRTTNSGGQQLPDAVPANPLLALSATTLLVATTHCDAITASLGLTGNPCPVSAATITGIVISGSNTLTAVNKPPFSFFGQGSLEFIYRSKNPQPDTSYVRITYTLGGPTHDTTMSPAPCASVDTSIVLANIGCDSIRISGQSYAHSAAYTLDSLLLPIVLPPGDSVKVHLHFTPTIGVRDSLFSTFLVSSNGLDSTINSTIAGTAKVAKPDIRAGQPVMLWKGAAPCLTKDSVLTIYNRGCDSVRITQESIAGSGTITFDSLSLPFTLAAGDSVLVHVHYSPIAPGTDTASISVTASANGLKTILSVHVGGAASQTTSLAQIDRTLLLAGTFTPCDPDTTISVTITNPGCDSLKISHLFLAGSDAAQLLGGTGDTTLAPGESRVLVFRYKPHGIEEDTTTLLVHLRSVHSSLSGRDTTITLVGSGVPPRIEANLTPATVSYGNVSICNSIDTVLRIHNAGCDTLRMSDISVSGSPGTTVTAIEPDSVIPPGATRNVHVHIQPQTKESLSSTLHLRLSSNAGLRQDSSIVFSGAGVDGTRILSAPKQTINFGSTRICEERDTTIFLQNKGCDTLTLDLARVGSTNFYLGNNGGWPVRVPPDSTVELKIGTHVDTIGRLSQFVDSLYITSDAQPVAAIGLTRNVVYPANLAVSLTQTDSATAGQDVTYKIILSGVAPADPKALLFTLMHNDDLLSFKSFSGQGLALIRTQVTDTVMQQDFRLSQLPADGVIGSITFTAYLAKAKSTALRISNLALDPPSPSVKGCEDILAQTGTNFVYQYACGQRELQEWMRTGSLNLGEQSYPNPAMKGSDDFITIPYASDGASPYELQISDIWGRIVLSNRRAGNVKGRDYFLLPTASLRAGAYHYVVLTADERVVASRSIILYR